MERTSHTAGASTVHEPFGSPSGPGLFHRKGLQLPAYIQHVAHRLVAQGHDESRAIEMAVGIVKDWAAGHDGRGNKVSADVQAAAAKAMAEWEADKARGGKSESRRSVMAMAEYDADGLDASWDGDLSDLPDLTGLGPEDFPGDDDHGAARAGSMALGKGGRFARLKAELAAKGAADPGGLAAKIGRRKFGKAKFQALAAAARKAKSGMSRGELFRYYPLEDIRILTRAEGDGSGTLVEAYATVFDEPAEIHDGQGHYMEVIDRSAFDDVLGRISRSRGGFASQVKVLYNHGKTMEGQPAPEYQVPIGVPVDIRPERRGLLTRTQYDPSDPFAERILSKIKSGAITAQSFVGGIVRSSPELRGPGDRYRGRGGALTTVRRTVLGLREYGPVLFPAYSGAEILGVRMSIPGSALEEEAEPDYTEHEEEAPEDGALTGSIPGEMHSARHHQHALYALRSREMRDKEGLVF